MHRAACLVALLASPVAAVAQSITIEELAPVVIQPLVPLSRDQVETVEAETGAIAVLRGLDKVNGRSIDAELQAGATTQMYGLLVTLRECRYPVENPTGDAFAELSIRDADTGEAFFDGWMIASSPALSALEHWRYDVWVLRCKSSS